MVCPVACAIALSLEHCRPGRLERGGDVDENAAVSSSSDVAVFSAHQARERTERAVKAAVALARAHGLRVDQPAVLADAYSVRVHLEPAPVVARVPTLTARLRAPGEVWLGRELAVVEFLVERGAPVVPPSSELPPGPHEHDGLALSFWQYVEVDAERTATPAETGQMLVELHAVLRDYPGELPLMGPPRNDIARALEILDSEETLDPDDLALLHAAHERLDPLLREPAGPVQPLHGDVHPGNLLVTAKGLLWNDFEDTCLGPIAWDLASLALAPEDTTPAHPDAPDPAVLAAYRDARMLQVTTWMAALPFVFPGQAEILKSLLEHWRAQGRG
jgi:hypothetical protein